MHHTLSKSEFKLAYDCPVKLKYKKLGYPKATDEDEFMDMLAEGGYMVGKLAQLLFPGGIDINADQTHSEDVYKNTAQWMEQENIVLFEAAFQTPDGKTLRADIIEKHGRRINLIEVKAKSWNSATYILGPKPRGSDMENVSKAFEPYLLDVTFQYAVLEELYPEHQITPYLFLPDKAKTTNMEGLNGMFSIKQLEKTAGGFKKYEVGFHGDVNELLQDDIMTRVDVSEFVHQNKQKVRENAAHRLKYLRSGYDPDIASAELDGKCKRCEFRLEEDGEKHGFKECWGNDACREDHFFHLYQFGNVFKGIEKQQLLLELIRNGQTTISSLPDHIFYKKDTDELTYNGRPYYQKTLTEEFIQPGLFEEMNTAGHPLYFIDFECSRMALPYHKHMRPYEIVAYQWSLHYYDKEGKPQHEEWINTEDAFPNFKFADALYKKLKNSGTILIWSHYEKTVLKEILAQHQFYRQNQLEGVALMHDETVAWLEKWVNIEEVDTWLADMEKMCKKYYFHPYTKGRSSIKPTLPAVINSTASPEIKTLLENFEDGLSLYKSHDGIIADPYESLPVIGRAAGNYSDDDDGSSYGIDPGDYIVRNGGAAMRAYQDMMYGFAKNDAAQKDAIKNLLLKYCKLDTLAMVIIWKYWMEKHP